MWAVAALICASAVAGAVVFPVARGRPAPRESPWDLAANASRMVGIGSGLAAFTITGVVLLLSFARQPADIGTPLSTAVGMFLVAFMSLITSALMFANLTKPGVVSSGVDVQVLQYSITTMMFFRSIFLGLLALRPLVDAYGLHDLAEQMGWLILFVAVLGGWTLSVAVLHRLALVRAQVVVLVPLLAFVGCAVAAAGFLVWPASRSDASPLYLAYALFTLNGLSFLAYSVAPAALDHPRLGPVIARSWGTAMAVVAAVSSMTIGFIWLATAGAV